MRARAGRTTCTEMYDRADMTAHPTCGSPGNTARTTRHLRERLIVRNREPLVRLTDARLDPGNRRGITRHQRAKLGRVIMVKARKKLPRIMTVTEVQAILDACGRLRDRFFFAVLHETGNLSPGTTRHTGRFPGFTRSTADPCLLAASQMSCKAEVLRPITVARATACLTTPGPVAGANLRTMDCSRSVRSRRVRTTPTPDVATTTG